MESLPTENLLHPNNLGHNIPCTNQGSTFFRPTMQSMRGPGTGKAGGARCQDMNTHPALTCAASVRSAPQNSSQNPPELQTPDGAANNQSRPRRSHRVRLSFPSSHRQTGHWSSESWVAFPRPHSCVAEFRSKPRCTWLQSPGPSHFGSLPSMKGRQIGAVAPRGWPHLGKSLTEACPPTPCH